MQLKVDETHRSIYRYFKNKANSLEGEPTPLLKKYRQDQQRYARREFQKSSVSQLYESIDSSDIIYLGDFHTFDQSTRNLERIIRILAKSDYQFAIGVEFIHINHQFYIDSYLKGAITELEFLESINYKNSWRFPWTFYKIFFDLAKDHNISILALNTKGNLEQRDKKAAKKIATYHRENPEQKLLILFGELHIVPNKLPQKVFDFANKGVVQTIIHQNTDEVYWKLVETNKLRSDQIVKYNMREFVLVNSPPWLKYESQIYWYEHLADDPEFDIHEYIIETGTLKFSDNIFDNFAYFCHEINNTLNLDIPIGEVEDFRIFDQQSLKRVKNTISKLKSKKAIGFYNKLLEHGKTFKLPCKKAYYCSSYSINRISYLAGIHIHQSKLKIPEKEIVGFFNKIDRTNLFVYLVHNYISAYFCSKLFNPYRKCNMYKDFQYMARHNKQVKKTDKMVFKACLKLCNKRVNVNEELKGLNLYQLHKASRKVSHMLADIIFDYFFAANRIEYKDVYRLVASDDYSNENYQSLLNEIGNLVEIKKLKKREF
ncbi:ChaN family lipoprotein [Halobacteriovorax sp. GFR7]|uniref:ChaN family lipoprotein n=1 Tax=unclassified Halobacteriovorax TaxID=2639665 RepID=UPI003D95706E